jgi:hypothetical protein
MKVLMSLISRGMVGDIVPGVGVNVQTVVDLKFHPSRRPNRVGEGRIRDVRAQVGRARL